MFRNSAAGQLKPRLCLFARCAPQMWWGCCNPRAGERKGAAWVARGSGFGLSGQPGISWEKAGKHSRALGVFRDSCFCVVSCLTSSKKRAVNSKREAVREKRFL